MALIKCSECGKEISDQASACPSCGFPLPKPPKKEKTKSDNQGLYENKGLFLAALVGLAAIVGGAIYASRPHKCFANIKNQLRTPDSMKIVSITKDSSYSKRIVVSSENGFGARLRTTFTCHPMTGGVHQGYID